MREANVWQERPEKLIYHTRKREKQMVLIKNINPVYKSFPPPRLKMKKQYKHMKSNMHT